jgi:hypothetical protein
VPHASLLMSALNMPNSLRRLNEFLVEGRLNLSITAFDGMLCGGPLKVSSLREVNLIPVVVSLRE